MTGPAFEAQGVRAIDAGTLTMLVGTTASISDATGSWRVVNDPAAIGGTYLVLDTIILNGDEHVDLTLDGLVPGMEYEVFATWHGDVSHTDSGFGVAQGRVTDSLGRPTEGVRVHVANAIGYEAVTDAQGRYSLVVPIEKVDISLVAGQNMGTVDPPTTYTQNVDVPELFGGIDFRFTPAIELTTPNTVLEGGSVDVQVDLRLAGELQWTVNGGPFRDNVGDAEGFRFTPLDAGVYTVRATLQTDDSRELIALAVIRVHEVPTILQVGDDLTISEGQPDLTRQLVIDPGNDAVTVLVDYGNGRREANEAPLLNRFVRIDEGDDGTFEQTLSVDDEGRFQFANLPIGLYRVVADFGNAVGATTPRSFLVEMTTAGDVLLTPIGFNDDMDGDGISNDAELNSPAGSDANSDRILDYLQGYVASVNTVGGPVTLVSAAGSRLRNVTALAAAKDADLDVDYPLGRLAFAVEGLPPGARASIELRTPTGAGINLVYAVDDATDPLTPLFAEYGAGDDESIEFFADRILLTGRDGGAADLDAATDGSVAFSLQPASVDSVWTNPIDATDVNEDGQTTALDALLIINALRRNGGNLVLDGPRPLLMDYLDVNGDGGVSAVDALQVINQMNRNDLISGEPEGEIVEPHVFVTPAWWKFGRRGPDRMG